MTLSEDERLILEVIEALGGEAQSHVLAAIARPGLSGDVLGLLIDLADAGLLLGSATGRFALTESGRRAVSSPERPSGRLTSWQRKQLPQTAKAMSRPLGGQGRDMGNGRRTAGPSAPHFGA